MPLFLISFFPPGERKEIQARAGDRMYLDYVLPLIRTKRLIGNLDSLRLRKLMCSASSRAFYETNCLPRMLFFTTGPQSRRDHYVRPSQFLTDAAHSAPRPQTMSSSFVTNLRTNFLRVRPILTQMGQVISVSSGIDELVGEDRSPRRTFWCEP